MPTKRFLLNAFRIRVFLFLSYLFGIETTIRSGACSYIPFVISSKIISDSRPKQANIYPFSDQNGAKIIPFGAPHTYMAYITENPPPPLPREHCLGVNGLKEPK